MKLIFRLAPLGVLLAATACGTDTDYSKAALVCPTVGVLSDASVLRAYGKGEGRDQANMAYELEFMRSHLLECTLEKGKITAALRFEARAKTGPAASSNDYDYSWFVAVMNPDGDVISKDVKKGSVGFKSGKAEAFFAEEYDDIEFSPPEGKDGLGYEILIGFQLTREEVELNRAKKAAPPGPPDLIMQK